MRTRFLTRGHGLAVLFGLLCAGGAARAAPVDEGVRIDQMHLAPPESPFFRAEGPHQPDKKGVEFAFGLTADYARAPVQAYQVDTAGNEQELQTPVENALLLHVGGSLTPINWLTLDFSLPFALMESGTIPDGQSVTVVSDTVSAPKGQGLGDLRVGAHVRPIDKKDMGLIAGVRFWAPIGSREAYLSDKGARFEIDLGVAGETTQFLYGVTAGISPMFFGGRNGDRIAISPALHMKVLSFMSVGIEPGFALAADVNRHDETSYDVMFEPLAAARLHFGGVRVGVGAGPGFGTLAGMGQFRGLLSIGYYGEGERPKPPPPKPKDADVDGILDKDDACPKEAGPDSSDPTKRGCPAQDKDADGVRDGEDACPAVSGVKHSNPKANGCPDSDNDELPDPIDPCPLEPAAAGEGGCPKHARLDGDHFKIEPPIEFTRASANLSADGQAALEEISATMRANPKIEQVSISLGTKGAPAALTDKRAQRLILTFRAGNLDSARYELVLRDDLANGIVEVKVVR